MTRELIESLMALAIVTVTIVAIVIWLIDVFRIKPIEEKLKELEVFNEKLNLLSRSADRTVSVLRDLQFAFDYPDGKLYVVETMPIWDNSDTNNGMKVAEKSGGLFYKPDRARSILLCKAWGTETIDVFKVEKRSDHAIKLEIQFKQDGCGWYRYFIVNTDLNTAIEIEEDDKVII